MKHENKQINTSDFLSSHNNINTFLKCYSIAQDFKPRNQWLAINIW